MEILGIATPQQNGNQNLICRLTEVEMDKITGIAGKDHTPHRYKAGAVVDTSKIYNKVKYINDNMDKLRAAMVATKVNAMEIENSLPLEGD